MKAWAARLRCSLEQLSPEQVALLLSVGLVLGVFPVIGWPTVFCLFAAVRLRLNPVALQLLNQISSPLQLALLLPLARAGTWICGGTMRPDASFANLLGAAAMHAAVGWACICVPLAVLLYLGLIPVARALLRAAPALVPVLGSGQII